MNNVEAALYNRLSNFAGITAITKERIFPVIAPQDIKRPFITYQRISSQRVKHLAGPSFTAQTRFQVDCYSITYENVRELSGQVRLALDGWQDFNADVAIKGSSMISDSDFPVTDTDPPLYRVIMDFMITHDEARS